MAGDRLSLEEALNLVKDLDNCMLRLLSLNRQADDFNQPAADQVAIARDAKDFFSTAGALQEYFEGFKKDSSSAVVSESSLQREVDELEEELRTQLELLRQCNTKTAHWQKKLSNMTELREKNLFGRFVDNSESE